MKKQMFICVFFLCFFNSAESATFGDLGKEINIVQKLVNNSLNKVEGILNGQQRLLFNNLQYYTEYLKGMFKQELKRVSMNLDRNAANAYNELRAIRSVILDESKSWTSKLQDTQLAIENGITRLPWAKKYPTPVFYDIPLITTMQERNLKITIKGVNLRSDKNYIVFAGHKCVVNTKPSDRENIFIVPLDSLDEFNPKANNKFEIYLFPSKKKGSPKMYTQNFIVLPERIATVTLIYKTQKNVKVQSEVYSKSQSATDKSGSTKTRPRVVKLINNASEGWIIDKKSVKCWKSLGRGKKHEISGPNDLTETSFSFSAIARKGKSICSCQWQEVNFVDKVDELHIVVDVKYNDAKHHGVLPEKSRFIGAVYKFYDGTESEGFISPNDGMYYIKHNVSADFYTVKLKRLF